MNTPDANNELLLQFTKNVSASSGQGGRDDSWKQHLEKAYFNKQVEAMKSTGPSDLSSSPEEVGFQEDVSSGLLINSLTSEHAEAHVFGSPYLSPDPQGTFSTRIELSSSHVSGKQNLSHIPAAGGDIKLDRSVKVIGKAQLERLIPAEKFSLLFSPDKESVQIFMKGSDAHLVIRNSEIGHVEVKGLLEQVKSILREKQIYLSKIIINGELYWEDNAAHMGAVEQSSLREEDVIMDKVF
ncbi:MAG: hypothetical protein JXR18_12425 [Neptuniibacter sp.]